MVRIDRDLEFPDVFPERQPSNNTGIKRKNSWHVSTIISHIGSPVSAFFATERYMNFPQSEHNDNDSISSKVFDVEKSSNTYPDTIRRLSEKEQILQLKRKLLDESDDENNISQSLLCFDGNKDIGQPSKPVGFVSVPSSSSTTSPPAGTVPNCKTRIRWSQELHDRFVQCVNCLGGTNKATPKAIWKLMDWEGLTIFHVKSHLQKYRNTKNILESGGEGKPDTKSSTYIGVPIDNKTGMQIKETLQLQLDAQRRLHEQLEIQRKLQLSIEEQGRQLKIMIDQQQKTTNFIGTQNSNTPSPT